MRSHQRTPSLSNNMRNFYLTVTLISSLPESTEEVLEVKGDAIDASPS
jgi:hypothetical protein